MKQAIFFFVLATICCIGIEGAVNNAGTAAITRLKYTTQSTTNDLDRRSKKLYSNLSTKLNNLKYDEIHNINDIVNSAINEIRSKISDAAKQGKDAAHCFEPARLKLREASLAGFAGLNLCYDKGIAVIDPVKKNISTAIDSGNAIVDQLDAILVNCLSSSSVETQNCIIQQLPNAQKSVNELQKTANELNKAGHSAFTEAFTSAFTCNLEVTSAVRDSSLNTRLVAQTCVDSV